MPPPIPSTGFSGGPAVESATDLAEQLARYEQELAWLRQERARYRTVADLLPGYAFDFQLTPEGHLKPTWFNPSLTRLLGTPEGWQGDVCDHLAPGDHDEAQRLLRVLRGGQPTQSELRLRTAEYGYRDLRLWLHPVHDRATGLLVRVYGAAEDLTAQRRAEADARDVRDQLAALLHVLPGAIARIGSDLRFIDANERLAHLLGASAEELAGQPVAQTPLGHALAAHARRFFHQPDAEAVWWIEGDVAGTHRHLALAAHKYEAGHAALVFALDVTERAGRESHLHAQVAHYQKLIQAAPEAIAVLDLATHALVEANLHAERLFKLSLAELQDAAFDTLCPTWQPDGRPSQETLQRLYQQAIDGDSPRLEWVIRNADGLHVPCELWIVRLPGEETHLRLSLSDITDRKMHEAELIAAREKAEAMNRLRTAFLANMSHEIRTPLTGIIGFASVLGEQVDVDSKELANVIERSGVRLLGMLNAILDLSMLESGNLRIQTARLDVTREVREALRLMEAMAREKGLPLRAVLPDGPLYADLDPSCLNRILTHLVHNALKFTQEGFVEVGVRHLHKSDTPPQIELWVRDTGIGISPEFFPMLFEGFVQESTGYGRTHEGNGLGLAISKQMTELMHGTIEVESEKGKGSAFFVRFPELPPDVVEAPPQVEMVPTVVRRTTDRPRILAVEDNDDSRRVLKYLLADYDLHLAINEDEALTLARQHRFDVVLMDVNLGTDRTGIDVLRELRRVPDYQSVPVIAVTAYAMPGDRRAFLDFGFDAYIGKPFTRGMMFEVLNKFLG